MATVVYITPHQDDELVSYVSSILLDVAGGHEAIVVIATRGENSGARTHPDLTTRLGYTPTKEEFSAARDREFTACVERAGGVPVVGTYAQREPDGGSDPVRMADLVEALIPGGADLVCGMAESDPHIDHKNSGRAARLLRERGWAGSVRIMVPAYRKGLQTDPPLSQRGLPVTAYHQEPYRRVDLPNGFWAVGEVSILNGPSPDLFEDQLADPLSYYFWPFGEGGVLRRTDGLPALASDGSPARLYRTWEPWPDHPEGP